MEELKLNPEELAGLDLFSELVDIRKTTVKGDDYLIKQALLHMVSAYLPEPANMGVEGPTSEGKTYPVVETADLFPSNDVWFLGGLSPTALAHDKGILVDERTMDPIESKVHELQLLITSKSRMRKKERGEEVEGFREELRDLLSHAAYLVDLEGKILLFLDNPNPDTVQRLYPILSHDRWEISYKFTDRKAKGGLMTRHVIVRGWPVGVFIRTKGEANQDLWSQTISRLTLTSPTMGPGKYRKAIQLKAMVQGLPAPFLNRKLGVERWAWARGALRVVREELRRIKQQALDMAVGTKHANIFWIPFYRKIGEEFPAEMGRHMRDSAKFMTIMQAHAAINVLSRPRLLFSGGEAIIVVKDDYDAACDLFFATKEDRLTIFTGLSRNVIEFFERVVLPLWKENDRNPIYYTDLVNGAIRKLKKAMSSSTIGRYYIRPLDHAGFVSVEKDASDGRRNVVRVLREDMEKMGSYVRFTNALNFSVDDLKEAWNELEKICAQNPVPNSDIMQKNYIGYIAYIGNKISKNIPQTSQTMQIVDWDGRLMSPEELHMSYFGNKSARISKQEENNHDNGNDDSKLGAFKKRTFLPINQSKQESPSDEPNHTTKMPQSEGSKLGAFYNRTLNLPERTCSSCKFYDIIHRRCLKHPNWQGTLLPTTRACEDYEVMKS